MGKWHEHSCSLFRFCEENTWPENLCHLFCSDRAWLNNVHNTHQWCEQPCDWYCLVPCGYIERTRVASACCCPDVMCVPLKPNGCVSLHRVVKAEVKGRKKTTTARLIRTVKDVLTFYRISFYSSCQWVTGYGWKCWKTFPLSAKKDKQ